MNTRLKGRISATTIKQNAKDRKVNELIATHCVPGGGKSYFLDQVAAGLKLELCSSHRFLKTFSERISVLISYNGGSNYSPIADRDVVKGLALRILWRKVFHFLLLSMTSHTVHILLQPPPSFPFVKR